MVSSTTMRRAVHAAGMYYNRKTGSWIAPASYPGGDAEYFPTLDEAFEASDRVAETISAGNHFERVRPLPHGMGWAR